MDGRSQRRRTNGWTTITTEHPTAHEDGAGGEQTEPAFRRRLDQLLSSALDEQAREQAGFMKVLQASRDALTAARVELDNLRALLEGRDQAVVDLLDERLQVAARQDSMLALQERFGALEAEYAGLKRTISVKLDSIAGSLEAVEWRTQESLSSLAGRVSELETHYAEAARRISEQVEASMQRSEALSASLETRLTTLAETLETRQQEVADAILAALDPVGRIMQLIQSRVARAASELAVAQGSLFSRLAEREERLERQRDEILADLLDEFAGVIKPRDRGRIGGALREADGARKARRDTGRNRKAPPA